jgi:hypothetical protein
MCALYWMGLPAPELARPQSDHLFLLHPKMRFNKLVLEAHSYNWVEDRFARGTWTAARPGAVTAGKVYKAKIGAVLFDLCV